MMNKLTYFLFCIPLVFTSCYKGNTYSEKLLRAEMLVNDSAQSALSILQDEIDPKGLTRSQFADWCLLTTKAKDKAYIKHESDSLINIAVDYYKDKGDYDRLVEAYFYVGRIAFDFGNQLKAQEYNLKALEYEDRSNNYPVLARVNNNLASYYVWNKAEELALPYYKKALYYFEKSNDDKNKGFVLRNIGRVFSLEDSTKDSSIYYYDKAILFCDSVINLSVYKELANLFIIKGELSKSMDYIRKLPIEHTNRLLSSYHFKIGNLDSAEYYNNIDPYKASTLYSLKGFYWKRYEIYKKRNKLNVALSYLEEFTEFTDSLSRLQKAESLRWVRETNQYHIKENEINEIKIINANSEKTTYQLLLLILFLTTGLISISVYMRSRWKKFRKKEREITNYYEAINKMNASIIADNLLKIKQLKKDFEEKESKEKEIVESRIKLLVLENEKLAYAEYQKKILKQQFKETRIYRKFHDPNVKLSQEDKEELRDTIETAFPKFGYNISKFYPKIKSDEMFMCYLFKTELKLKLVAQHMNLTPQAIVMKRERLYFKIFKKKGSSKEFEDFIESL